MTAYNEDDHPRDPRGLYTNKPGASGASGVKLGLDNESEKPWARAMSGYIVGNIEPHKWSEIEYAQKHVQELSRYTNTLAPAFRSQMGPYENREYNDAIEPIMQRDGFTKSASPGLYERYRPGSSMAVRYHYGRALTTQLSTDDGVTVRQSEHDDGTVSSEAEIGKEYFAQVYTRPDGRERVAVRVGGIRFSQEENGDIYSNLHGIEDKSVKRDKDGQYYYVEDDPLTGEMLETPIDDEEIDLLRPNAFQTGFPLERLTEDARHLLKLRK